MQAALLNQEELIAPNQTTHDSAFTLLLHMLDSEWGWRIICQEGIKTPFLWEIETIPDLRPQYAINPPGGQLSLREGTCVKSLHPAEFLHGPRSIPHFDHAFDFVV